MKTVIEQWALNPAVFWPVLVFWAVAAHVLFFVWRRERRMRFRIYQYFNGLCGKLNDTIYEIRTGEERAVNAYKALLHTPLSLCPICAGHTKQLVICETCQREQCVEACCTAGEGGPCKHCIEERKG